eukprot:scaffold115_cov304-Prasinococcus_capsulatus_cf.AAC.60
MAPHLLDALTNRDTPPARPGRPVSTVARRDPTVSPQGKEWRLRTARIRPNSSLNTLCRAPIQHCVVGRVPVERRLRRRRRDVAARSQERRLASACGQAAASSALGRRALDSRGARLPIEAAAPGTCRAYCMYGSG